MTNKDIQTTQNMLENGEDFAKHLALAMRAAKPEDLEKIKKALPELLDKYTPKTEPDKPEQNSHLLRLCRLLNPNPT